MSKQWSRVLLAVWLVVFFGAFVQAETLAEPDELERLSASVNRAKALYMRVLEDEFGVKLSGRPITIRLANGVDEYADMREDVTGNPKARRDAQWSGGVTFPPKRTILLRVRANQDVQSLNATLWHEMTHMLQYEYNRGYRGGSPQWTYESMASFFSAVIAENAGGARFEDWMNLRIKRLRKAGSYPNVIDVGQADGAQWKDIASEEGGLNYAIADLLMVYLYLEKGPDLFSAMVSYLQCLGDRSLHEVCFSEHYGVDVDTFLEGAQTWIDESVRSGEKLVFEIKRRDTALDKLQAAQVVLLELMRERLIGKQPASLQLRLSISPQQMLQQYKQAKGSKSEIEEKISVSNTVWVRTGGIGLLDASRLTTDVARAQALAAMQMTVYQNLNQASKSQIYWMHKGVQAWISDQLCERLRLLQSEDSRVKRESVLAGAKKGTPSLTEIATLDAWTVSSATYGRAVVEKTAAQMVYALIEKKGVQVIKSLLTVDQQPEGAMQGFVSVVGESPEDFYRHQAYLGRKPTSQAPSVPSPVDMPVVTP